MISIVLLVEVCRAEHQFIGKARLLFEVKIKTDNYFPRFFCMLLRVILSITLFCDNFKYYFVLQSSSDPEMDPFNESPAPELQYTEFSTQYLVGTK